MKKLTLFSLSMLAALSALAQGKMDPSASLVLDAAEQQVLSRSSHMPLKPVFDIVTGQKFTAIVRLSDEDDLAPLDGYEILDRRGDMAIVRVTAEEMKQIVDMPQVECLSLGNEVRPLMNVARENSGVNAVQTGAGVLAGNTYTGKGVIAGILDTGLDVNHINFLDDKGEPRTQIAWVIQGSSVVKTYRTPEEVKGFKTDNKAGTHGTHVLGIMAGSYKGPGDYAYVNNRGAVKVTKQSGATSAIPYYGIATDADLAVACADLKGSSVELGISKVVDYAKEQGKPCVINVSIGNTSGPHDGTDARSQYIARLGEDAIIVLAAGNDGGAPVSLSKTFTASDNTLKTFGYLNSGANGTIDFWGADNQVYSVTFIAYSQSKKEIVYSYTFDKNLEGKTAYITGNYYTASSYIHDDVFDAAFGERGALIATTNIDPNNNRYNVHFTMQFEGEGEDVVPGFIVEGKAGQRVDAYAFGDAAYLLSLGVDGFSQGNSDCSISGMACGDNILTVGSYTNVSSWLTLSGQSYAYNNKPTAGALSSFSSYGTTFDGRVLPEVCAPGGSIIASYSKYYIDAKGQADSNTLAARYTGKTRSSYWDEMQGTSMAAPFVSGIIATWLEADPTLTIDDVKDIIKRTAVKDEFTAVEPHRWGAGKINALEGIKAILNLSAGVNDIVVDDENAPVEYFNLQGVRVERPESGLVIRRQGNKVEKIIL